MLGSTGIAAACDVAILMGSDSNDRRYISTKGRVGEPIEKLSLGYSNDTRVFSVDTEYNLPLRDKLIETIAKQPGVTQEELKQQLKKRQKVLTEELHALLTNGRIHFETGNDGRTRKYYVGTASNGDDE